ncbi:MAG: tetratricopeptide repeat-containing sensor histidine kinase [Bacteroidales bacterium]|jgi:signal transduction histidine kinase
MLKNLIILLLFISFSCSSRAVAGNKFDSIEITLKNAKGTDRIKLLNTLSYEYSSVDLKKSLSYAKEALILSSKSKYMLGEAIAMQNLGLSNFYGGNYNKALKYIFNSIQKLQYINNTENTAFSYYLLGLINDNLKNYTKSIDFYNKALKIYEEIKDTLGQAKTFNNIGSVYKDIGEYDDALKYLSKALKIFELKNDIKNISVIYSSIGNVYFLQNNYPNALKSFKNSLTINEQLNDIGGEVINLNNIGEVFKSTGNYDKAMEYFMQSLKYSKQINNISQKLISYNNIAGVYFAINDFKNAYQYKILYGNLLDSILNKEKLEQITKMQIIFETENLEKENQLLKFNNDLSKVNVEKQKAYRNLFLVGFIATLILLVLSFGFYRIIKRSNKLLKEQKENIAKSNEKLIEINEKLKKQKEVLKELNEKLLESEENLREINERKDKFFSIISHDLRNPFASIVSFARIMRRDLDKMKKEEILELTEQLNKVAHRINNLLENLLLWSKMQTNRLEFKPEEIKLSRIVNSSIELLGQSAKNKNINLTFKAYDNITVYADYYMVDTVLRNLISNAIKFTHSGGFIKIITERKNDDVLISVEDNGIGIKKSSIENLFEIGHHSDYGTEDEKGSGLGLILCKEFVLRNKGKIWVESEENKGSSFKFTLPLNKEMKIS